ncbi:MAG: holB: polymerase delta subunit [Candidatus Saccharibacteria bacterium]|nr:holB: polymerase delta subunit [Candidatus Saccharibacteria bacterium]
MLLQSATRQHIDNILVKPAHAIKHTGEFGAGKAYVAKFKIPGVLGKSEEKLQDHPYYKLLSPTKSTLSIDQIRVLNSFLSLKTVGKSNIKRAILIEDAHTMTVEAQNALLKLLEEPPRDTVFVLTAVGRTLKPTIYSRVQLTRIHPVSATEAIEYFKPLGYAEKDIIRYFHIANGAVGLMHSLLSGDETNLLAESIDHAKQLLGQTAYERLAKVDQLSKKPDEVELLLYAFKRICLSALEQAATKQEQMQVERWQFRVQQILDAQRNLKANANQKLLLANLFVNL